MRTPLEIANTFLMRDRAGLGMQHMKLQKLVYYAYGWWLTARPNPLTQHGPEVWKYGPVFSELYRDLRGRGDSAIVRPVPAMFDDEASFITEGEEVQLVDWILKKYGKFSAIQLSNMTHKPGTPWRTLAEQYNFSVPTNLEIPVALMRDYFSSEAARAEIE